MNLINTLPITLAPFNEIIPFEGEEEKMQLIASVADRVSSIYAAFLTAEWHAKRDNSLSFDGFPQKFPPAERVEVFKLNLKNAMIRELNKGDENYDQVHLSTDIVPEKLLLTVLEESGISLKDYRLNQLFSIKTGTRIQTWNSFKQIRIYM